MNDIHAAPDYSLGFVDTNTVLTLLRVMTESRALSESELSQWLWRPGVSDLKVTNTFVLLEYSKIIEIQGEGYSLSAAFIKSCSRNNVETSYKESILASITTDDLGLLIKHATILDSDKLVWLPESVSPFHINLRDLLVSLEILLMKDDFIESSSLFYEHLKKIGLVVIEKKITRRDLPAMTIEELMTQLDSQNEFGNAAEELALQYEVNRLNDTQKVPQRVSQGDVRAGYDIISFESAESKNYDRLIEVKSCSDSVYRFYISTNELSVAEREGESYYLYLYNRSTQEFTIIQDPYRTIILDNSWTKSSKVLEVYKQS